MQTQKKREELLVTELFLSHLNQQFGTRYLGEAVPSEATRVDARGVSLEGDPAIDIQVTYADNGLPHEGGSVLGRKFRAHMSNIIDLTTPYDIAAAIERKQDRYGRAACEKLVLLIWKTRTCIVQPEGINWQAENIWFRGCYYVCLPGGGTPGQVVTLKPLLAPDGTPYAL